MTAGGIEILLFILTALDHYQTDRNCGLLSFVRVIQLNVNLSVHKSHAAYISRTANGLHFVSLKLCIIRTECEKVSLAGTDQISVP